MTCDWEGCPEDALHFSLLGCYCKTHQPAPEAVISVDALWRAQWWDRLAPLDQQRLVQADPTAQPAVLSDIFERTGLRPPSRVELLKQLTAEAN